ncbi:MAG: plasmid recombination protein [Erysipelotrichaceae bacterium]|nr:plasmid recombination protein [Erysipelotrichaceae bacterium]MBQ6493162.1 plasmid recombination protein [Erysipelotrichaceae bacterium]
MQYNIHNEKYQTKDVGGIMKEQFRQYEDSSKYRNYVDEHRTLNNVYKAMSEDGMNWYRQIREAKESTEQVTGKAIRKDAVVLCSTVESVPSSWDVDICQSYFQDKADWFREFLEDKGVDKDSLLSVAVHLDETTPHATYAWLPMKDEKLQAKNILDKQFLRDLQKESQDFTFKWIDEYNSKHLDQPIEKMDPYQIDSGRKHLQESEYKEMKIAESVQQMQQQLVETKQQIGDLNQRSEELTVKTQEAAEAKQLYEDKFIEITEAPDIKTYETVVEENTSLKEELSLKDRIIERLQEEAEKFRQTIEDLKETAQEWKDRFTDMAHKAGSRLMEYFGYDVKDDSSIRQFPSKEVSAGISELTDKAEQLDPKSLRVIPDDENEGMFRVVSRQDDGSYQTVQGGFADRDLAEQWQRSFGDMSKELTEDFSQGLDRNGGIK